VSSSGSRAIAEGNGKALTLSRQSTISGTQRGGELYHGKFFPYKKVGDSFECEKRGKDLRRNKTEEKADALMRNRSNRFLRTFHVPSIRLGNRGGATECCTGLRVSAIGNRHPTLKGIPIRLRGPGKS